MKHWKHIIAILLLGMLACPYSYATDADETVRIMVNGETIAETGVLRDGRVLMPVRELSDAIQGTLLWVPVSQEIIVSRTVTVLGERSEQDKTLTYTANLQIGATQATCSSPSAVAQVVPLAVPPQIMDGKTLVSVRDVCELLGAEVTWYPYTKTVWVGTL